MPLIEPAWLTKMGNTQNARDIRTLYEAAEGVLESVKAPDIPCPKLKAALIQFRGIE